jgi:23S rRNA (adenine2030-N6)-methyltransferase
MLSYRHSYHAGNYADVLKHSVLMHIIEHLKKKDKPFCVIHIKTNDPAYASTPEQ